MTTKNNTSVTAAALRTALTKKEISSAELTKKSLLAIKKDPFNSFITVNEHAPAQAKQADQMHATGSATDLTGIPVAIKDVLVTEGLRTTAGSRMLEHYIPPYTATAVQRLIDAGMVIVGKTNCDEFAMGSSNENSAFGPVKNPYDPMRVPGGSSGGSAVAVAAGYAPVALGTDTGGSVRLPASFCGVIGFKPTYGRISRYGLIAMASSHDQVGLFAHTAEDTAAMLQVLAGHDPHDATSSSQPVDDYSAAVSKALAPVRIGIPKEYMTDAPPYVRELMERAMAAYRTLPQVTFVDIELPHISYALAVYYICMSSEVSANLARYDGLRYGFHENLEAPLEAIYRHNRSKGFGPEVRRRIMLGTYSLSAGYFDAYYAQAAKVRNLLAQDFTKAFSEVDVILSPTSPTPPFKIGEKITDPLLMYLSDIYTVAANLVGIPAVSYPAGLSQKLPIGVQLMGPAWSESRLLNCVHHLQPLLQG